MDRIIQSPGKYIQGAGAIKRLGDYLKPLAERWLVVGDKFVPGFAEEMLRKSGRRWRRPKSRRLAVSVRIMKSTAYAISPATRSAPPCWGSAVAKPRIPRKRWPTL
ncbi:hypothetical protein KPZU09_50610 [Klebsiella pneumoniae]|uniref:Glycerol dehydrogenase n=1 Tax=Klebsiella pneumoniae TaxID=573 RepID=A0A919HW85_KLEPN|nr:hypothetical protein KPZU09_50610 [Klebsiella pneumoniae]